jgi:hypothetical protein
MKNIQNSYFILKIYNEGKSISKTRYEFYSK